MKIYSMTATFGKLENQTLTLEPGLNVIHAPNEWGKSTWCAFLVVMLYGLDTRAKTTKTQIADKERYAPWSGLPMSGSMDLCWRGRNITIQRRPKGRTPMGDFSAYETNTGLPVPELTATTCGQTLLGVERSVFQRAGFIQLSDMPVTQDESLRRRLNALVTTGDEGNASDALAQKLKELKNHCRYNRTGLLPQAEAQRTELENKLRQLQEQQLQVRQLQAQQAELETYAARLENHKNALAYAAAQDALEKAAAAQQEQEEARLRVARLEAACHALPAQPELLVEQGEDLQAELHTLVQSEMHLPQPPMKPMVDAEWTPEDAREAAQMVRTLEKRRRSWGLPACLCLAAAALGVVAGLLVRELLPAALVLSLLLAGFGIWCRIRQRRLTSEIRDICGHFEDANPDHWELAALEQKMQWEEYGRKAEQYRAARRRWEADRDALNARITEFTGGKPLAEALGLLRRAAEQRQALALARRDYAQAVRYAENMATATVTAEKPGRDDTLTLTEEETRREMADTDFLRRQLNTRLGKCQGAVEHLGSREQLEKQLLAVDTRIAQLTKTYDALDLALQTLQKASNELQRRFAPRISRQAQQLFGRLTGGRYNRLTLQQDLSIQAGAETETTLHTAQWRSDGTIDQLYLALRLAVARELTPGAPLVLDDAFARFDDDRLAAAMEILREEAQTRQVILFSCQSREKALG